MLNLKMFQYVLFIKEEREGGREGGNFVKNNEEQRSKHFF